MLRIAVLQNWFDNLMDYFGKMNDGENEAFELLLKWKDFPGEVVIKNKKKGASRYRIKIYLK